MKPSSWALTMAGIYTLLTAVLPIAPDLELLATIVAVSLFFGAIGLLAMPSYEVTAMDIALSVSPMHGMAGVFLATQVANLLAVGMYRTAWLRIASAGIAALVAAWHRKPRDVVFRSYR